jgi:hypothetical protein
VRPTLFGYQLLFDLAVRPGLDAPPVAVPALGIAASVQVAGPSAAGATTAGTVPVS